MDVDLYADLENPFFPVSCPETGAVTNEVHMHYPCYLYDHNFYKVMLSSFVLWSLGE